MFWHQIDSGLQVNNFQLLTKIEAGCPQAKQNFCMCITPDPA